MAENFVNIQHYGDQPDTDEVYSFKRVSLVEPTGKRIVNKTVPNSAGGNVFHSFRFTYNVNTNNPQFEPVYFGVNYTKDHRDL